jgi:hypothetical protein
LKSFKIGRVLNMGDVFEGVTRPACVVIVDHADGKSNVVEVADFTEIAKADKPAEILNGGQYSTMSQATISELPGTIFVTSNVAHYAIWNKSVFYN